MKRIVTFCLLVLLSGCMPASQQEVLDLHNTVSQIVPLVKDAVATSSEDTKEKVNEILSKVESVNEAIVTADDPVEAIEKGWTATEAWNPYYGYGVLALGLLRLFQKKKESETALEEVVTGIDDSKSTDEGLKKALIASESMNTRKIVAKIRSKEA